MSGAYYPADGKVMTPARRAVAVTPSDSTELAASFGDMPRAIWVGGAGNLSVLMADDGAAASVTLVNVQSGTLLPIRARRVNATNTTASSIVALY